MVVDVTPLMPLNSRRGGWRWCAWFTCACLLGWPSAVLAAPPLIVVEPEDRVVAAGSNVTLTVTASGTAPLAYQWFLNPNTPLAGATSASLLLTDAQPGQNGLYSVVITNAEGSATSREARVFVFTKQWVGGGSGGDWVDPVNWSGETVPAEDDAIWIPTGSPAVTNHAGGTLSQLFCERSMVLEGAYAFKGPAAVSGPLALSGGSSLTVNDAQGSFEAQGAITAETVSLVALAGGRIELIGLTNYATATSTWEARGAGSRIHCPNLLKIWGPANDHELMSVQSANGGVVSLPTLEEVMGSRWGGGGHSRGVQFSAGGAGSVIDLSALIRFEGLDNPSSKISVADSGQVLVPNLAEAGAVSFEVYDGLTLRFPSLTQYRYRVDRSDGHIVFRAEGNGSKLEFPSLTVWEGPNQDRGYLYVEALAGGRIEFPVLEELAGSQWGGIGYARGVRFSATGTGSLIDLPVLRTIQGQDSPGSSIAISDDGQVSVPNLAEAGAVSFQVSDGLTLRFPTLTHYRYMDDRSDGHVVFRAEGSGSRLEFPSLTVIEGPCQDRGYLYVEALTGGTIACPTLSFLYGSYAGGLSYPRGTAVLADGNGSVIDLSALELFAGSNWGISSLNARNGGVILIPSAAIAPDIQNLLLPRIAQEPLSGGALLGGDLELTVTVDGNNPLYYQWRFDGANLTGATHPVLQLTDFQPAMVGFYDVIVSNSFGMVTSRTARVVVETAVLEEAMRFEGNCYGAAWGDYDGDGYLDLYVSRESGGSSFLFRNNGDGTLAPVVSSPTLLSEHTTSVRWVDYDNDGDLDLFVNSYQWGQPPFLFRNDGGSLIPASVPPFDSLIGHQVAAAWADYDRDGWLDVYIANELLGGDFLLRNLAGTEFWQDTRPPISDQNNSGAAVWVDYDGDGWSDLFVGSRVLPSRLYRNQLDGTFVSLPGEPWQTEIGDFYSGAWGDSDNDGLLDVFLPRNGNDLFYRGIQGGGFIRTETAFTALAQSGFVRATWGDYDNDGDLDLLIGGPDRSHELYANQGNGDFARVPGGEVSQGRHLTGAIWVDYDRDGDLDLLTLGGPTLTNRLFTNRGNGNAWLLARCLTRTPSDAWRDAIGAKVRLQSIIRGHEVWQLRDIRCGSDGGEATTAPMEAHFGLGDATHATELRIEWPSGKVSVFQDVAARQFLTIREGTELQVTQHGRGEVSYTPVRQDYLLGESITLSATPDRYYRFLRWNDGDTNPVRVVTVGLTNFYTAIFTNTTPLELHVRKEWERAYGGTGEDYVTDAQLTPDGGVVVVGASRSGISGNKTSPNWTAPGTAGIGNRDCWVLKLDREGAKEWEQTFGGVDDDQANAAVVLSDGGMVVAGYSSYGLGGNKTAPGYGGTDLWVIRLDEQGNRLWDRLYGDTGDEAARSVIETSDGGLLVGTEAGGVLKLDAVGNLEWNVVANPAGVCQALAETATDYRVFGHVNSGPANYATWAARISFFGTGIAERLLRRIAPGQRGGARAARRPRHRRAKLQRRYGLASVVGGRSRRDPGRPLLRRQRTRQPLRFHPLEPGRVRRGRRQRFRGGPRSNRAALRRHRRLAGRLGRSTQHAMGLVLRRCRERHPPPGPTTGRRRLAAGRIVRFGNFRQQNNPGFRVDGLLGDQAFASRAPGGHAGGAGERAIPNG